MDGYVDLALSAEEIEEQHIVSTPLADVPKYPYGTSISLDEKVLEKMGVDYSDWKVGDIFHIHAMAKVTSISEHESQDGEKCCVSMQLIAIKGESEDAEDEEDESEESGAYTKDEKRGPDLKNHGYLRYD